MKKRYLVRLTPEEREQLDALVRKGRAAAYRRRHAEMLLLVDQGGHSPGLADRVAAERVGVNRTTVENIRQRFVLEGLEAALGCRARSRSRSRVVDGEGGAQLVAMACSEPDGRARWTLHLLADELRRRRIVALISHETVRKVQKKRRQPLEASDVVHSAEAGCGVRVCDGAGSGGVHAPPGLLESGVVHGRDEEAVRAGDAPAAAGPAGPGGAV